MKQRQARLKLKTFGAGFTDLTDKLRRFLAESGIKTGLMTVFVPHTSASLLIQENADPDVLRDLKYAYARLAPHDAAYRHRTEGPDDMPAHIRAALSQTSLGIPVEEGALVLGVWQAVYLFEHREERQTRDVALHLIGD